ncbi:hypothetical protein L2E82_30213 [Cichorium intybus]|uniref:Uncharacterized protein n=1 Tax=Cichorium intybus TaxID=13427 RepID=A0ACB9CZV8_CICIN|nr:hypothetical protein L2E82_30213 [Cichorium intybus]
MAVKICAKQSPSRALKFYIPQPRKIKGFDGEGVRRMKLASQGLELITTIGFIKEAPFVNNHGFNVYHENRLILPFWPVLSFGSNRGRGVVGVLEANFMEPTQDKQDFEKTSLFQKLIQCLKEMTWENCQGVSNKNNIFL